MKKGTLAVMWLIIVCCHVCDARNVCFYGGTQNDLYRLLIDEGYTVKHFDSPTAALRAAGKGDAVFLVARNYPELDSQLHISGELIRLIKKKKLRVYLEYPSYYEGMTRLGPPVETRLERAVVTSDVLAPVVPKMGLLGLQNSHIIPVDASNPVVVQAKVVGFDYAAYGLADTEVYPVLFEQDGVLISTTGLTNFQTGRYGPVASVRALWEYILANRFGGAVVQFRSWPQDVKPAFTKEEALPSDARMASIKKGVDWFDKGHFFLDESWRDHWLEYQGDGTMPVGPPLTEALKQGDGSLGILEGHTSTVNYDGSQQYRYWIRADVQGEASMALAAAAKLFGDSAMSAKAYNLADFVLNRSNMWYDGVVSPDLRGLLGWSYTQPHVFYGDDNARAILGVIAASAYLETTCWNGKVVENILANFRTTGINGFRGANLDASSISKEGWKHFSERDLVNPHPHFEAWLWACYLWLYNKTGYQPLLEKTKRAIAITMEAYPNWNWTNGIQQERARMILPLAWLVRVEDTPQHRQWLDTMVEEVIRNQDVCGAIREELGDGSKGMFGRTKSNAEYGLHEAPLIFENGDPVADMLYTCNFAFFGLNEAAKATANPGYVTAVSKLSDFLTRIQVDSQRHPDLDGAWFRAFDYNRWDYWASNADAGWGTWSTLTGWIQSWIVVTQAHLAENTSFWDQSAQLEFSNDFEHLKPLFLD